MTKRLGYRDPVKGVRRLHLWVGSGEGHRRIIEQISRVTGRGAELERAIAETREMKKREWEESVAALSRGDVGRKAKQLTPDA